MTPEQYCKLLRYIMKNNSWENMLDVTERKRSFYKYVTCSFDTRDGTIWRIAFSQGGSETAFRVETPEEIQAVYDFLDGKEGKNVQR